MTRTGNGPARRECLDEVSEAPAAPLVVDLSEVTFIASVGLALLVALKHHCNERGVAMALVATGSVVLRAIEVTGLDKVIPVHTTVDEAIGK